ncbi:MAG TPA: hypothetical protein VFC82_08135 [Actinomycetaceae bacterium]|nr:hypothetical protein [Actinomycetaceae bacterium]
MTFREKLRRLQDEDGSAVIEFLGLAFVLLIPLVYLVIAFFQIQGAAFAAEGAARDAGRLMAAGRDELVGRQAAAMAIEIAFDDAGITADPVVSIACGASPCLTGGATIQVIVSTEVPLPLIPLGVVDALGATVPVEGTAVHVVDRFVDR